MGKNKKKKLIKYPETPMRNCFYCHWYNHNANACDHPKGFLIATFNTNLEKDCILLSYKKIENPEVPPNAFAQKYCIGTKCPYYYSSKKLCTRPSLCPYKKEEITVFTNIQLKEDN